MANYNVASGFDLKTLNKLSGELYEALYPDFFKDTVEINNKYLYSVSYDAKKPIVFDFNPPEEVQEFLKTYVCEQAGDIQTEIKEYIEKQMVTIGLSIPVLNLELKKTKESDPIKISTLSLTAGGSVDVTPANEVIIRILTAKIKIPGEKLLEELVNEFAVPVMIDTLNDFLAKGIKIPPLDFGFISFSTPVAAIQDNTLVAFSALASRGETVAPETGKWPANKIFGFFDDDVADIVISHFVRNLKKSGTAKADTHIGICKLKLEASYSVGLRNPEFKAESGDMASAGIQAYGGGSASLKCGVLHPSVGLGISAAPNVKAGVVVNKNNKVEIVFKSVNSFKVDIDIKHLPSFLKKALNFIVNTITGPVIKLIGSLLTGLTIPVYPLPEIPVKVKDKTLTITIDKAKVDTISESGEKKYVGAEGIVSVKKG